MKKPPHTSKSFPLPPILIVLIGLPASGKSMFAQYLAKELTKKSLKVSIVDTDKIRADFFGPEFNAENEPRVLQVKQNQITQALKSNAIVIVDDMHYYESMRHDMYSLARKAKGSYLAVEIQTPLEKCILWNNDRGSPIPNTLIQDVHAKFDSLGKKYRWDHPFFSIDLAKTPIDAAIVQFYNAFEIFLHQINLRSKKSKPPLKLVQHDKVAKWDIITRKFFGDIINHRLSPPLHAQIITTLKIFNLSENSTKMIATHLLPLRHPFLVYLMEQNPDLGKEKLPSRETLGNLFLSFLRSKVK